MRTVMPKALVSIDREFVKALFLQGLKQSEICAKTGLNPRTLKTWANRGKWVSLVSKTKQALETVPEARTLPVQVAQESALRSLAKRKISSLLGSVPDTLPKRPAHASAIASATLSLTSAARQAEGWTDTTAPTVNIALLATPPDQLQLPGPSVTVQPACHDAPTPAVTLDAEIVGEPQESMLTEPAQTQGPPGEPLSTGG